MTARWFAHPRRRYSPCRMLRALLWVQCEAQRGQRALALMGVVG